MLTLARLLGQTASLATSSEHFQTSWPVKLGNNTSAPLILNTGAPQGCVLSPLLYFLFTHDCMAMHTSNSVIKFADDTTVVGLFTNNDETAYREEVRALRVWCQENNLLLNVNKTKETAKGASKGSTLTFFEEYMCSQMKKCRSTQRHVGAQ